MLKIKYLGQVFAILLLMGPLLYALDKNYQPALVQSFGGGGTPPETQWFTGEDDLYCEKRCYDPETGEPFIARFWSYICEGWSLYPCVGIGCDVSCWDILF